jgi:hypothetical protein
MQPVVTDVQQSLSLSTYLRMTAKRAHLDFFTLVSAAPGSSSKIQPDLEDYLAPDGRPLHWGINE